MVSVLGAFNALIRTGKKTQQKEHTAKDCLAAYKEYQFRGIVVCKTLFQFVYDLGKKRLNNKKRAFLQESVH